MAGSDDAEPAATGDEPLPAPSTLDRVLRLVRALPGRGVDAWGALDGVIGDQLAHQGSSLALPLTFRTAAGEELPLDPEGLRDRLPDAGDRLCVFVHGLMSSERVWAIPGRPGVTYGDLLARDHGVTPVYVRYNTGRHISTNGRELARRLQELVRCWPVRVREIDLVGHSMGGLVVRSACHYGRHHARLADRARRRGPWPAHVRRLVLLGTPNTGANLEVVANLTSSMMWAIPTPVTRLLGATLDRRSEGIKDLRWGAVLDDDWLERDPGGSRRPTLHPVRLPPRARILVVAGSLVTEGDGPEHSSHPVNRALGDALVTASSAAGLVPDSATTVLPAATVRHCPSISHVALANRPEVYDLIHEWWDGTGPASSPTSAS